MLANAGPYVSFAVGLVLLIMSTIGVRAFYPRIVYARDQASRTLALAIVLGFTAAGLNALYWQIVVKALMLTGHANLEVLQVIGYYLDIIFKGLPSIAIYLHLKAWHLTLNADERRQWSVLGLVFYPSRTLFLSRMLNRFTRDS